MSLPGFNWFQHSGNELSNEAGSALLLLALPVLPIFSIRLKCYLSPRPVRSRRKS